MRRRRQASATLGFSGNSKGLSRFWLGLHTAYVIGSAPDARAILSHPKTSGEQLKYTIDHGEVGKNGKCWKKIS